MTNYYWHFARVDKDGRGWLDYDLAETEVVAGLALEVDGPVRMCANGLHASRRAMDALHYAPGAFVSLVELSGEVEHDNNKSVATKRTVIACADATRVLHEFAIWCAEQALALVDTPDPRSLEALAVKRRWLNGEATDEELDAASSAACASARASACAFARAAVAAVRAAVAAAWAAARYAANSARNAANSAARNAANSAARNAARDAQNERLEKMLLELLNVTDTND